jgi:urease accessory protein UreF
MAAKDIPGKVGEAELRGYLKRILEDQQLRNNLASAYGAAISAYGRVSNGKSPTKALFEDRKLQRDLTQVAATLRDASGALREPPKSARRSRRRRRGRTLMVLIVAGVLAVALSQDLRTKVLDLLFGAEEEFDYSSSTTPAEPAPPVSEPAASA